MSRTRHDGQGSRPSVQPAVETNAPAPSAGEQKNVSISSVSTGASPGASVNSVGHEARSEEHGVLADAIRRTLLASAGEQLEEYVQSLAVARPDLQGSETEVAEAIVASILERSSLAKFVLPGTISWIADELVSDPMAAEKLQQLWRQSRERNAQA